MMANSHHQRNRPHDAFSFLYSFEGNLLLRLSLASCPEANFGSGTGPLTSGPQSGRLAFTLVDRIRAVLEFKGITAPAVQRDHHDSTCNCRASGQSGTGVHQQPVYSPPGSQPGVVAVGQRSPPARRGVVSGRSRYMVSGASCAEVAATLAGVPSVSGAAGSRTSTAFWLVGRRLDYSSSTSPRTRGNSPVPGGGVVHRCSAWVRLSLEGLVGVQVVRLRNDGPPPNCRHYAAARSRTSAGFGWRLPARSKSAMRLPQGLGVGVIGGASHSSSTVFAAGGLDQRSNSCGMQGLPGGSSNSIVVLKPTGRTSPMLFLARTRKS